MDRTAERLRAEKRAQLLADILEERHLQINNWSLEHDAKTTDTMWLAILMKYIGIIASDLASLRSVCELTLIKIAAICVAWAESR